MTAQNLKDHCVPIFLKAGSIYSTAQLTNGFDLAPFAGGAVIIVNILAIATASCTYIVQDSDDGVTYTSTDYTTVQEVTAVPYSFRMFLHPAKLRRFVRLRFVPSGSVSGGGVDAVGFGPHTGIIPAGLYDIDTGS